MSGSGDQEKYGWPKTQKCILGPNQNVVRLYWSGVVQSVRVFRVVGSAELERAEEVIKWRLEKKRHLFFFFFGQVWLRRRRERGS